MQLASFSRAASRLALTVALMAAGAAQASVVWTLNNFQFADGATASGTFTWDEVNHQASAWHITTTDGWFAGHLYSNGAPGATQGLFPAPDEQFIVFGTDDEWYLRLALQNLSQLDTAAAHLDLYSNRPAGTGPNGYLECDNCGNYRLGNAGAYLSAEVPNQVPEPGTGALSLLAVGVLAAVRRRS